MNEGRLAVITARGGSKRIPRKNIKDFCGKPIIAYSIEVALGSGLFDEVMVSTDDEEIAAVARSCGANVPFMRSAAASDDYSTTADVLLEVLDEYGKRGSTFETLCCIYPTAPFITASELREAYELMAARKAPGVAAVASYDFPPQRGFLVSETGTIEWAFPEYAQVRSQDLPVMVHDCGRFYFCNTHDFRAHGSMIVPGCLGFAIDASRVQDIDTVEDWEQAEFKFRYYGECR